MTYFLMMSFVFLTLLRIGAFLLHDRSAVSFCGVVLWAALGTYFVHNILGL